uniref:Uncharacterized protein n=1 Tax=Nelumbo nucifera TaxID=4432 RepID=A0A822ZE56_NELNU|nr:TPA_asm: hypothetical protein HUJ06_014201 [Nelumbo nucifera]
MDSPSTDYRVSGASILPTDERSENTEVDDDLFEIDLEVVNNLPPPFYWESNSTATDCVLLANCLLPISDVSGAVPVASTWRQPPPVLCQLSFSHSPSRALCASRTTS